MTHTVYPVSWSTSTTISYGTGSPWIGDIVIHYKCELCGKDFKSNEIHTTLNLKDKVVVLCGDCSSEQMGKLITAFEL
jgi:hypothetical protein